MVVAWLFTGSPAMVVVVAGRQEGGKDGGELVVFRRRWVMVPARSGVRLGTRKKKPGNEVVGCYVFKWI
jgi:hypothetical protein